MTNDNTAISKRLADIDWSRVGNELGTQGYALLPDILTPAECAETAALYPDDSLFRKRIDMGRHRYGIGDYGYFADPLPDGVRCLREGFYERLTPIANVMMQDFGRSERYPAAFETYRNRCHAAGQTRPTPLLLRYEAGGHNRLHRDLYGDLVFPLQVAIALSKPGQDYNGGSFLLVENRPREQARGEAVTLEQGMAIVFPTYDRPVDGKRGKVRAEMRHGVSTIHNGERYTLGIIFHDAA